MEQLYNILNTALTRYFNTLSKMGYMSYNEVYKIITVVHIINLLSIQSITITEQDVRAINNTLSSLLGSSCLFTYEQYKTFNNQKLNFNFEDILLGNSVKYYIDNKIGDINKVLDIINGEEV